MKVLVFTDSHGKTQPMVDLVAREKPDAVFHLGDLVRDGDVIRLTYPDLKFYQVPGNCDLFSGLTGDPEGVAYLAGKTFFFLHGHTRDVKYSPYEARQQALALRADVLLFGHTHIPYCEVQDDILVFNPGALQNGRYGVLTWEEGGDITAEVCLLD